MNGRNINEPDNCGKLVACFRDLTTEELEQINRGKTELTYLAGENLFKQGAFSTHLLLIAVDW